MNQPHVQDDAVFARIATAAALAPVFRGRLCESLLHSRAAHIFEKDEVLYELGDTERLLFFIQWGVVKTGTATEQGREIIYHVRKDGDVVGELCATEAVRLERAVAVERTAAIAVGFDEVVATLAQQPALLGEFIGALGAGLTEAYEQVNRMAEDNVVQNLVKVLKGLALKMGRPAGELVEIPAYLTQEELSQMVVARRERVSTALNSLRRRGLVQYTKGGHLLLDVRALEAPVT